MRIVILDGFPINPGDLDWKPLESLGELVVHDRTQPQDVVDRAQNFEIVLTNKTVLARETIRALPQLKYIGVLATGYNIVDVPCAVERGIVVTNIPGYARESVAQHVFALILDLLAHTSQHVRAVNDGRWVSSPDWSFTVAPVHELSGKTIGIVGLGAIGRRVALIAQGFGMNVIAAEIVPKKSSDPEGFGIPRYHLDELLSLSDVVSLHCPLTEQTKQMINADSLKNMKPTAILVNTARGQLIDEQALAEALRNGRIGGAGLDVLSEEPPSAENPLLNSPRCLITPHVAWASIEARRRLIDAAAQNIKAYLGGTPENRAR